MFISQSCCMPIKAYLGGTALYYSLSRTQGDVAASTYTCTQGTGRSSETMAYCILACKASSRRDHVISVLNLLANSSYTTTYNSNRTESKVSQRNRQETRTFVENTVNFCTKVFLGQRT